MEFDGKKLECKNIFFTDETRIDTAPNTSGDVRTGWSILSYFKKKIKVLINEFFGDKYIQNAPHSPDMAYPIETLWTELKKKGKR